VKLAASQLLRALRGRRSQTAFARRLGYRANPITDWERGQRYPTAKEALRAAARVGVDVPAAFTRFTPRVPLATTRGGLALSAWLTQLVGTTPVAALSRSTGVSRSTLTRWFSGRSSPRFPDFLQLVDAATGRVPELVAQLVSIDAVPALRARHEAIMAAKQLAFDEPWTEAILRLLEIAEHEPGQAHAPGQLAARLGIAPEDEVRCLEALARAGVVTREGDQYRARPLSVDTGSDPEAIRRLKHHWAQVAGQRALAPRAPDWLAYNVVSCSSQDLARIRELLAVTFRELRAIVASSEPSEVAALINMHLVHW
jgi:transcriptional regulator with XRE-family HTH domain